MPEIMHPAANEAFSKYIFVRCQIIRHEFKHPFNTSIFSPNIALESGYKLFYFICAHRIH